MVVRVVIGAGLLTLLLAPLAGGLWRGLPTEFGEFPPRTQYIHHAPFSPVVFVFLASVEVALVAAWWHRARSIALPAPSSRLVHPFPPWGWAGLILAGISWLVAWARWPVLGRLNDHTFFPLWLGYILTLDALVQRRTGSSLLRRHPRTFAMLFPASSIVWWYFEYLNRFVQNWHYVGAEHFSAIHYGVWASLCFSTVLPAVFETRDWLQSFPTFERLSGVLPRAPVVRHGGALSLVAGAIGLVVLARAPNPLFFLTWLAPLAVLGGTMSLAGLPGPLSQWKNGDGRPILTLSLAALFCGLFWEMWNYYSLPKWTYTVPYVQKFPVFEMPLLGFAGYLPFGPICGCFWLTLRALVNPHVRC